MRSRRLSYWFALLALAAVFPGVLVGRALRWREEPSSVDQIRVNTAQATDCGWQYRRGAVAEGKVAETLAAPLVVPPDVIHRIEVQLMDGTELNRQECRLIGMEDSQIKSLSTAVRDCVSRWQEREKAVVKVIPSSQPGLLLHIPAADPKVVEEEYDAVRERVHEDAGPALEPLVHMRLTDGYTPRSQSNIGTGMLNVLTGGFGSLERFIKVTPARDGSWVYEVTDVLPRNLDGVAVDEGIFAKLGESLSFECRRTYFSGRDAAAISHLPRPD